MVYEDFIKLQNELKDIIVEYTCFLKKGARLDLRYTYEYKDEISTDFRLRNENTMLVNATTMLNDKKSLDEVDKYIQEYKNNYSLGSANLSKKILAAQTVFENKIDDDSIKELENHFLDISRRCNPLLKMDSSKDYYNIFNYLQMLYQQNNYQTYFAAYDLYKNMFVEDDFHNVDFEKYINYYMNLMQKINMDTINKKKGFPFNKEEVFEDEISIARERGDFKANLSKLKEANKAIKEDFKLAYGEIVELN